MRSLLFVPAHDARKLAKGLAGEADALIVDLEDAVPDAEKARARGLCAEFVQAHRHDKPLIVRINAPSTGLALADLAAVVRARPHGVMLPKCGGAADVALLDAWLAALETRDDVPAGSLRILPIVTETAAAVLNLRGGPPGDAAPRVSGLLWGGEDLAADIGAGANRDRDGRYTTAFAMARSLALMHAAALGVDAIDAVYTDFRNPDGLQAEAADAARDGFAAKAAIHPDQVGVINAAFTPPAAAVEQARRIVAAFDAAPAAGAVAMDGRMLDRPHLRGAQRVLARSAGGAVTG